LDDFGTGYSSLSQLNRLPLDELKVDCSFVSDIGLREDARKIIGGVVALAHSMGLKVVAEGVESRDQEEFLCRIGCDEAQGYYYAPPLSAPELATFVARWAA
jgi:EAL domain-containing protein (putative c-di-GMP-specific phosphodiesterase class I)